MAYDKKLAQRLRDALSGRLGVTEKAMFGGLAFLLNGNICCGVVGGELMVRVGPDAYESALAEPHARPMDFTGRPLRGFVFVAAEGASTARALRSWAERGASFAASLPPKRSK